MNYSICLYSNWDYVSSCWIMDHSSSILELILKWLTNNKLAPILCCMLLEKTLNLFIVSRGKLVMDKPKSIIRVEGLEEWCCIKLTRSVFGERELGPLYAKTEIISIKICACQQQQLNLAFWLWKILNALSGPLL